MTRATCLACVLVMMSASAWAASPARSTLPSVAPDGSSIAFISDRDTTNEVYVIGASGEGERRIPARGQSARWQGKTLWVTGTDADTGLVFAAPMRNGRTTLVTKVRGRSPRLSPDGKHVLYSTGSWTSTALMVAEAPGGTNARAVAGGRSTAWNGAWSPDGKRIAYTYGDSTRVLQVHVVNADGSGDHALTHMSADQGSAQMPAWSPDGTEIAFQVNQHATKTAHVWMVDLRSGEAHEIASHADGILDEAPAWFPDGKQLAFQSTRSGSMQIWKMRADGSDPVQVTGRGR